MVMAPVADVDPDGTSVMGSRAYSRDRAVDVRMVTATLEGYLAAGIVPVVKHFPGLGSVSGDSHHALPVQHKSLAQLRRTDLVTFQAAIGAGAPVIMTAHLAVDAIEPGMPGSISKGVVQGLLRDTLGFKGVAVTDSQGMGPINGPYNSGEGAVRSLIAGDDLVLNSPYPTHARRALQRAVASGRLLAARLAEAATRVLALRMYQQRIASAAG
jgi:beta-N-acetylhexosaminidase